jgi:hypothetical protein
MSDAWMLMEQEWLAMDIMQVMCACMCRVGWMLWYAMCRHAFICVCTKNTREKCRERPCSRASESISTSAIAAFFVAL